MIKINGPLVFIFFHLDQFSQYLLIFFGLLAFILIIDIVSTRNKFSLVLVQMADDGFRVELQKMQILLFHYKDGDISLQ